MQPGFSTRAVSDLERGVNHTARKDTVRLLGDALGLSGPARDLFETVALGHDAAEDSHQAESAYRPPEPATPLIGRTADVNACCDLLLSAKNRLVTITGLGGVGKTRTALAVTQQVTAHFADGVRFVGLSALADSRFVITSIARAAKVR